MGARYEVTGAVAVLKIEGGRGDERYLYHGAPVDEGVYEAKSIQHAIDVGLVSEVEAPAPAAPAAPAKAPDKK